MVEADLAVLCIGFKPNTSLLTGKVEMAQNGAIITNDYMQSSDPDIFAAGDSAAVHYNPTGKNATFRWPPTLSVKVFWLVKTL